MYVCMYVFIREFSNYDFKGMSKAECVQVFIKI